MKYRHIFAITVLAVCLLRTAIADIGSLSCSDIGEVAAAAVVGKARGSSLKDQLLKIEIMTKGSPAMRKILSDIIMQIYTAPWADKLSEHGARMAFTADCQARRLRSVQAKRSNQPLL
jgi:hypothetical protein